jgi:hypothetical protein
LETSSLCEKNSIELRASDLFFVATTSCAAIRESQRREDQWATRMSVAMEEAFGVPAVVTVVVVAATVLTGGRGRGGETAVAARPVTVSLANETLLG